MLEIDLSKGEEQLLRIIINFSILLKKSITVKNIFSNNEPSGLNKSTLFFLQKLVDMKIVKISGLGIGSSLLLIEPLNDLPKKILFDLESSTSSTIVVDSLLLPLLFARKKINLVVKGNTHGDNHPSALYYKEVFFKYLFGYLENYDFRIPKVGLYSEIGEIEIFVEGKNFLENKIPKLIINKPKELVAIKGYITNNDENYLLSVERILNIFFSSKKTPFRLNTILSKSDSSALVLIAYFGDEEGYDNSKPFLIGNDLLSKKTLKEKDLIVFLTKFKKDLENPSLDNYAEYLLLPLLAFVGGKIPLKKLTNKINSIVDLLEKILDIQFIYEEGYLKTKGYLEQNPSFFKLSDDDLIDIDDL